MGSKYTENKQLWDKISEIDYFPLFVSAWLSLNAWYRGVYESDDDEQEISDRDAITNIKDKPNGLRNAIIPQLKPIVDVNRYRGSQEEESFRTDIALLHTRLDAYEIHTGKGKRKLRIHFAEVYLREYAAEKKEFKRRGIIYLVEPKFGPKGGLSGYSTSVKSANGKDKFRLEQDKYDFHALATSVSTSQLNDEQRGNLLSLYRTANPRRAINLLEDGESVEPITCGSVDFKCSPEDLYAGVIETLYQLRCHLFHGELVPNEKAAQCYEPAYRILKHMLRQIR